MAKRKPQTKDQVRKRALHEGRTVLWQDKDGSWRAATDWRNTPAYAVATEDLAGDSAGEERYRKFKEEYYSEPRPAKPLPRCGGEA